MAQHTRCFSLCSAVSLIVFSLAAALGQGCTDVDGWVDSEGDSCDAYVTQNYCTSAGGYGNKWSFSDGDFRKYADKNGLDATQACCGCGKAGLPVVAPACGTNELFEFSVDQRCQPPVLVSVDINQCKPATPPVSIYRLSDCGDIKLGGNGYQVAVSYASPSSSTPAVTGKTCLFIDGTQSTVVLSVPHRAGQSIDCSGYCIGQCKCKHFDLTSVDGTKLLPGGSATFSLQGNVHTLKYNTDGSCATTDQYSITGPSLIGIAIPSFGDVGQVASGTLSQNPVVSPDTSPRPSRGSLRRSGAPSRSPSRSISPSIRPRLSPIPFPGPFPGGVQRMTARLGTALPFEMNPVHPSDPLPSPSTDSDHTADMANGGPAGNRRERLLTGAPIGGVPMGQWTTFIVVAIAMGVFIILAVFHRIGEAQALGVQPLDL